jgi:hypothetical protein
MPPYVANFCMVDCLSRLHAPLEPLRVRARARRWGAWTFLEGVRIVWKLAHASVRRKILRGQSLQSVTRSSRTAKCARARRWGAWT